MLNPERKHHVLSFRFFKITDDDQPLIDMLPASMRVALRHVGSMQALADLMHVKLGTAKSRTNRAKHQLTRMRAVQASLKALHNNP